MLCLLVCATLLFGLKPSLGLCKLDLTQRCPTFFSFTFGCLLLLFDPAFFNHWIFARVHTRGAPHLARLDSSLCPPNPAWQRVEPLCSLLCLVAVEKRVVGTNMRDKLVQPVTRWRNVFIPDIRCAKFFNVTEKFALEPAPYTFSLCLQRLESDKWVALTSNGEVERLPYGRSRVNVLHDATTTINFLDFDGVHVIECLGAAFFKLQEADDATGERLGTVFFQCPPDTLLLWFILGLLLVVVPAHFQHLLGRRRVPPCLANVRRLVQGIILGHTGSVEAQLVHDGEEGLHARLCIYTSHPQFELSARLIPFRRPTRVLALADVRSSRNLTVLVADGLPESPLHPTREFLTASPPQTQTPADLTPPPCRLPTGPTSEV